MDLLALLAEGRVFENELLDVWDLRLAFEGEFRRVEDVEREVLREESVGECGSEYPES